VNSATTNPRVALVRAESYERESLDQAIGRALRCLGGLERFVRPGMSVLLKPNLLSAKAPERAITTDPEFVAAVGRAVKALGARVIIGDSPAGAEKGIDRLWQNCGMTAIAQRDGFELVNFELSGSRPVTIGGQVYHIAKPVLDAGLVISLPKLKTHVLTLMTGGVKNTFGCIPGFRKGLYHKEAPKPQLFARVLVDIFSAVRPALTIMDAIVAMEGDGPSSGTPRQVGLAAATEDAVALDAVMAAIVGLSPDKVHTTRFAGERGLGENRLSHIETVGMSIKDARVVGFKLTSNTKMELIPKFAYDAVSRFIWQRPKIDDVTCTQCQACVDSCPTGAMVAVGLCGTPAFNEDLCINCWCCHEICPSRAIGIEKSWLARRIGL